MRGMYICLCNAVTDHDIRREVADGVRTFAQLQQTQSLNDQITNLISSPAAAQATGLIGRTIDYATNGNTVSGQVTAVSFSSGQPQLTITTSDKQTIGGISIADVSQIR